MDQPSSHQFDLSGAPLSTINYATLQAMLTARAIASFPVGRHPDTARRPVGTMADRIGHFAGRDAPILRPSGPFAPSAVLFLKRKGPVYLGASMSGRVPARNAGATWNMAISASAGEQA